MFHNILEDSWSYQEIVQKGFDQGLKQGKLLSARSFLTRFVEKRFPPLLPLVQKQVAHVKTFDKLSNAFDKLLEVQTIEQAKQVLEEIKKQPHRLKQG
jgi:flagellar biosynthesis/type III secretory pathway protein FliH